MPNILPKIDRRDQQDLVNEIRSLILQNCPEWGDLGEIRSDKQVEALTQIFSNMTGKVIERLNQAPDKNFVAFLNMIGVSPTPPKVAKAPLVFKLKEDWDKNGFIPAGTKISAQPENEEEVVFETKKDLMVIQPKLVRAASIEPLNDCWSNQDFLFYPESTGEEAGLFIGEKRISHRLYLGHSRLLSFGETAHLNVNVNQRETNSLFPEVLWYYFDKDGNICCLNPEEPGENLPGHKSFSFRGVSGISRKKLSGYDKTCSQKSWDNNWIFAELKNPLTDGSLMPDIEDIKITLSISPDAPLLPDLALCNDIRLDTGKDFHPFGDKPAINDTFYIASREAFSKENAVITVGIEFSDKNIFPMPDTGYVKLCWEYWDGKEWHIIFETEHKKNVIADSLKSTGCYDRTDAFTIRDTGTNHAAGTVTFACPQIKPCTVNGEENYWVRVRIIGGDYGNESQPDYTPKTIKIEGQEINVFEVALTKSTLCPPAFKKVTINYTYSIERCPEMVVTENNFVMEDKTAECVTREQYFKPFSPSAESDCTFYLAFDRDISNLPVSILFPLNGSQLGRNPVVAWEYWNGRRWLTLSVNDALRHFTRREILEFSAPSDIEKCTLFGEELYWIRARLESGKFDIYPKVRAIYSNVVWANNSNTLDGVILGSSNGEPNQEFQLSRVPVLTGQEIRVCETLGNEKWVLWEEVKTFSLSGTDSRHYMLDHSSGNLIFGDSKNGMVPPAGVDNIKCSYKQGGGARGNVKEAAITKMWDNLHGIDSVTNPVPADGGFNQEEPEEAKIRGPHTLKSLERGVTSEDVEWLVREAAPQIAMVKCLPNMDRDLNFSPGKATVIVVPEYEDPKPVPSQELLNDIDAYLSDRISAVLNKPDVIRVDVTGPDYIRVGIEAEVKYTDQQLGKIIEGRIIDNLKEFFDPLHGGQEKTGWGLGKNLYVSEVCSVIKNTAGVDYIENIAVKASVQCFTLNLDLLRNEPFKPGVTYPKYSAVRSRDNRIVLALAEKLQANKGVKTILAKGFRENDNVVLRYRNYYSQELVVVSVDGDILECRTVDEKPLKCMTADGSILKADYPAGTDVETVGTRHLKIRSQVLNQVNNNSASVFLKIAVFEPRDVILLCRNDEYTNTTPLKVREVRSEDIFMEEDELVFGGIHLINKKPYFTFPFLLDKDTGIIHDLSGTKTECHLEQIAKEDRIYLEKTTDAPSAVRCSHCFA